MAYAPIALTMPQYEDHANWYLKAYTQGTTTPLSMATDSGGGTTLAKSEIDANGFPTTDGSARFIPYINGAYDLWMFPTSAEADANDTTNAIQLADNINADPASSITVTTVSYADNISALLAIDGTVESRVNISGYHTAGDGGGGEFYWDASQDKANHNGGTIIDPDITFPSDWTNSTQVTTWFTAGTGTGCWVRVGSETQARYFGASPSNNDNINVIAIQGYLDSLAENSVAVFDGASYAVNGVISLSTNNITIIFQGTTFLVGDTGASGSFDAGTGTVTGKIGFLFDQADNLTILGEVTLLGQGTVGVTSLAGMVFSQCDNLSAEVLMRFDTMAAGRFVINCDRPVLGNAYGNKMDGLQTFESPPSNNAGSTEVLIGCYYGRSGDVFAFDAEKPARYLSVGFNRNNIGMVCGASVAEYDGTSLTSHALGIRSAIDCSFGPSISIGGNAYSAFIAPSSGDGAAGYSIDNIFIESVLGVISNTGASVDALLYVSSADVSALGHIHIGNVQGSSSGSHNIFVNSGRVHINQAILDGNATRQIQVAPASGTGHPADLTIDHLTLGVHGGAAQPVTIGKGGYFKCDMLEVLSGPVQAVPIVVYYNSSFGDGSYHRGIFVGDVLYEQNSSANNYAYLVYDDSTTAGPANVGLRNVLRSNASSSDMLIGSLAYSARSGQLLGVAAPSLIAHGTWRIGDQIWDSTPTSASAMGWTCSVAGNPGTWLTMPSYP